VLAANFGVKRIVSLANTLESPMNDRFGASATVRAAALVTAATHIAYGLGLIVSALIARDLGPEDYGRYAYAVWVSGVLVMLINHGLTSSAIRFIAENIGRVDPRSAARLHHWFDSRQILSLSVVLGLFVALAIVIVPSYWNYSMSLFVTTVGISAATKSRYIFQVSIAKGFGRFDVESLSTVVVGLVSAGAVGILVLRHSSLPAYLAVFTATSVAFYLYSSLALRRRMIMPLHEPPAVAALASVRRHVLWTMLLVTAGYFGNKSIETLVLSRTAEPSDLAFFAIAVALTRGGLDLLTAGLSTVLMPLMGHAYGAGGSARVSTIVSGAMRYYAFLGLGVAGVGFFMAPPIVDLLYGQQYEPVIAVFRIMLVVAGLTATEAVFGALLSTTDNQPVRVWFAVISVAVSAVFAIALIPQYGLWGAVLSHAISRLIVFAVSAAWITRALELFIPMTALVRLFIGAVFAALIGVIFITLVPGLLACIAAATAFFASYLLLTVMLRAWTPQDLDFMLERVAAAPRILWARPFFELWRRRFTSS
jgi:O-antigen/teichoic acid export membrane protein